MAVSGLALQRHCDNWRGCPHPRVRAEENPRMWASASDAQTQPTIRCKCHCRVSGPGARWVGQHEAQGLAQKVYIGELPAWLSSYLFNSHNVNFLGTFHGHAPCRSHFSCLCFPPQPVNALLRAVAQPDFRVLIAPITRAAKFTVPLKTSPSPPELARCGCRARICIGDGRSFLQRHRVVQRGVSALESNHEAVANGLDLPALKLPDQSPPWAKWSAGLRSWPRPRCLLPVQSSRPHR